MALWRRYGSWPGGASRSPQRWPITEIRCMTRRRRSGPLVVQSPSKGCRWLGHVCVCVCVCVCTRAVAFRTKAAELQRRHVPVRTSSEASRGVFRWQRGSESPKVMNQEDARTASRLGSDRLSRGPYPSIDVIDVEDPPAIVAVSTLREASSSTTVAIERPRRRRRRKQTGATKSHSRQARICR